MSFGDHKSHSRPLDIHAWSDHPEINIIVDKVWHALGAYRQGSLTPKGNRKGTDPRRLLKVLLVNLYETFLDDPTLWTGVARSANAYAPTSRNPSGRVTEVRLLHQANAHSPTSRNPSAKVTEVRLLQPRNAHSSKSCSPSGKVTEVRLLHSENAAHSTRRKPPVKVTEVRLLHPSNAP